MVLVFANVIALKSSIKPCQITASVNNPTASQVFTTGKIQRNKLKILKLFYIIIIKVGKQIIERMLGIKPIQTILQLHLEMKLK